MFKQTKDNFLYYEDVFASIQGESTDAGFPCVFVRLYGCNIGCSFCDQKQDVINKKRISLSNLVSEVMHYKIPNICITGGEPLLQWNVVYPLVLELVTEKKNVSIETSGCIPIEFDDYSRKFKYVMDIKCPSSGVAHKNILSNLMRLKVNDEVKFVISNREDYEFAKKIIYTYPTSAKLLFSPCFDENFKPLISKDLIDWMIEDSLFKVRVQIQMHKCLGVK